MNIEKLQQNKNKKNRQAAVKASIKEGLTSKNSSIKTQPSNFKRQISLIRSAVADESNNNNNNQKATIKPNKQPGRLNFSKFDNLASILEKKGIRPTEPNTLPVSGQLEQSRKIELHNINSTVPITQFEKMLRMGVPIGAVIIKMKAIIQNKNKQNSYESQLQNYISKKSASPNNDRVKESLSTNVQVNKLSENNPLYKYQKLFKMKMPLTQLLQRIKTEPIIEKNLNKIKEINNFKLSIESIKNNSVLETSFSQLLTKLSKNQTNQATGPRNAGPSFLANIGKGITLKKKTREVQEVPSNTSSNTKQSNPKKVNSLIEQLKEAQAARAARAAREALKKK